MALSQTGGELKPPGICECVPDIPAPSEFVGDCGEARPGEAGCSDAICEECVCDIQPACCMIAPPLTSGGGGGAAFTGWDPICVGIAAGLSYDLTSGGGAQLPNGCATSCLARFRPAQAPALSPLGMAASILVLLGVSFLGFRRIRQSL